MPLLDLRTNLKSLKYGQDLPGGGNSGQPFIQAPLPEAASQPFLEFYENNKTSADFPVRGGKFDINVGLPYVTLAAKFDRQRISRFLQSAPRGRVFLDKQKALQLSNPKIQVAQQVDLGLGTLPFRLPGGLETTRIYNEGKNTLAQVGVQGSGYHFNRHGAVPVDNYKQTYAYVADDIIRGNTERNRLILLYEMKINRRGRIGLNDQSLDIRTINDLGLARLPELLFQYPGGPGSAGGLGLTTIRRYVTSNINALRTNVSYIAVPSGSATQQTPIGALFTNTGPSLQYLYDKVLIAAPGSTQLSQLYKYNVDKSVAYAYKNQSEVVVNRTVSTDTPAIVGTDIGTVNARGFNYAFNYTLLKNIDNGSIGQQGMREDFRKVIVNNNGEAAKTLASTQGYTSANNIATKYGIGNPGSKNFKRVEYNKSETINGVPTDETHDLINKADVGETGVSRDLITFRFDTIEINQSDIPVVFRAFLTGLQDAHSAEYNPFRYTGRGENFYTYTGFTREISFNFKIAAQSRSEMRPLYRKLNFLLSQLYPDYRSGTGFMRAPMIKVTIGDYLVAQPGFLKSMNLTIPDEASWEIANNQTATADDDMYQLPQMIDVACSFTPIHNFLPRRATGADRIPPFITPNTPGNNKFGIGKLK